MARPILQQVLYYADDNVKIYNNAKSIITNPKTATDIGLVKGLILSINPNIVMLYSSLNDTVLQARALSYQETIANVLYLYCNRIYEDYVIHGIYETLIPSDNSLSVSLLSSSQSKYFDVFKHGIQTRDTLLVYDTIVKIKPGSVQLKDVHEKLEHIYDETDGYIYDLEDKYSISLVMRNANKLSNIEDNKTILTYNEVELYRYVIVAKILYALCIDYFIGEDTMSIDEEEEEEYIDSLTVFKNVENALERYLLLEMSQNTTLKTNTGEVIISNDELIQKEIQMLKTMVQSRLEIDDVNILKSEYSYRIIAKAKRGSGIQENDKEELRIFWELWYKKIIQDISLDIYNSFNIQSRGEQPCKYIICKIRDKITADIVSISSVQMDVKYITNYMKLLKKIIIHKKQLRDEVIKSFHLPPSSPSSSSKEASSSRPPYKWPPNRKKEQNKKPT